MRKLRFMVWEKHSSVDLFRMENVTKSFRMPFNFKSNQNVLGDKLHNPVYNRKGLYYIYGAFYIYC